MAEGTPARSCKPKPSGRCGFRNSIIPIQPTYGLGFGLQQFDGHLAVGHAGAIYGFATQLEAIPDTKLGVVVITTLDSTNAVTNHIAAEALHGMLATRAGTPLTPITFSRALPAAFASRIDGRYGNGEDAIILITRAGRCFSAISVAALWCRCETKMDSSYAMGVWAIHRNLSWQLQPTQSLLCMRTVIPTSARTFLVLLPHRRHGRT